MRTLPPYPPPAGVEELLVVDSHASCGVLLSEVLDIPNVVVVTGSPNDMLTAYRKAPLPLSFVPIRGSGFPSNMTFIQRVRTLVDYFFVRLLMDLLFIRTMDDMKVKFNIKVFLTQRLCFTWQILRWRFRNLFYQVGQSHRFEGQGQLQG